MQAALKFLPERFKILSPLKKKYDWPEDSPHQGGGGEGAGRGGVEMQIKNGNDSFESHLCSTFKLNILQLQRTVGKGDKFFPLTSKYGNARISVTTFLLR